ncbi:MAG: leucyl aminopeptidase [Melioribacter sp.]|nr:leucyl aminopeptidase [Melioribacter sp.]
MLFNLKFIAENDLLKFEKNSALVKFFIDTNKLERQLINFFDSLNLKISDFQKQSFLDKKNDELVYHNSSGEPSIIFIKKLKIDKEFNCDFFRNFFAGLIKSLSNKNLNSINIVTPIYEPFRNYFDSIAYLIQTIIEGIFLGNYTFDKYKSDKSNSKNLSVKIHYTDKIIVKKIIDETEKIMSSVYFARDLVNEPPITLTPIELAKRAKEELKKHGITVRIFDKNELKKRKMNAILAVGNGSNNPPCMIVCNYKPNKPKKKIALVGKGVTYDSGGLSIKPSSGMSDMKADMSGGAVVLAAIKLAAMLKLPIELIAIVPAVENMPGGNSYKPGDVIVTSSGKSIEVKDTDAEGRIILADALYYASLQKPDQIIDFATLTGSCVVALGEIAAGLFTSNDDLAEKLYKAGMKTFERVWRLPFWNDYKLMIKSEIADVANLGPRWGGAITAAKFLEHFVDEKIPWAHIDIAGPAIKHKSNNYTERYDTGFGVRLIIEYLKNI